MLRLSIVSFAIPVLFAAASHASEPTVPDPIPSEPPSIIESIPDSSIPDILKEWIPWVLQDETDYGCTMIEDEPVCTWPSALTLRLTDNGGEFRQRIVTDRENYLYLPGSVAQWPERVTVNGAALPVLTYNELPMVRLPAGTHVLAGTFRWRHLPEGLNVPAGSALIDLYINDTNIPFVQRDAGGRIWLRKSTQAAQHEEALSLEVFRRVSDGVPMMVTTHIVVRSPGNSGEVTLENVQLDKSAPMAVDAEIPVRLTPEGNLKIQSRGGTWHVEIQSIVEGNPDTLSLQPHNTPWPKSEIWVFAPNEQIRQTEISGLSGIDAHRTSLKNEWKSLAAYQVSPGDTMTIHTTRRGEPTPPLDRITASRKIWLDMDGTGCTIADTISGTLSGTSRLDLMPEAIAGHIQVNGADQVITTHPDNHHAGVEIRHSQFEMRAESRLNRFPDRLRAVGWSTDVQELHGELNLPPGWNLIAASGVDSVPGTWFEAWTLFGFFFVLLASIATARLTRWYYGILTLLTLILLHNEVDIEVLAIVGLPLLVGLALLKALPRSTARVIVICGWSLFGFILVATTVPFSVDQVRKGIYPQLEEAYYAPDFTLSSKAPAVAADDRGGGADGYGEADMAQEEMVEDQAMEKSDMEPQVQMKPEAAPMPARRKLARGALDDLLSGSAASSSYQTRKVQKAMQQDPEAVVQTGPGVPDWRWNTFQLNWQGPVSKDHQIELYLTNPVVHLILSILRVILLALLAGVLILQTFRAIRNPPATGPDIKLPGRKAGAATAVGLLLMLTTPVQAQLVAQPGQETLMELKNRLLRSPACAPDCVDTANLHIEVKNGQVAMTATVHAGTRSAWPIPGPAGNWIPDSVVVDGIRDVAMRLQSDGFIYVQISPGIHQITVSGAMKSENAFTLEFERVPHTGSVDAAGYDVEGLREDGHFETSIAITRRFEANADRENIDAAEPADAGYTPWLKVVRSIDLGIPWLIHTTVTRVSPTGTPLMFRIPLIKGESVTASDLEIKDGTVTCAFGREDTEIAWSSILTESPRVNLRSPKGKNWTETWHIECSPIWQCDISGIPPVSNTVNQKTFQPWPGETVTINTRRPRAMVGQTVTVDRAKLNVSPGLRLAESTLTMSLRSSQGGVQKITLPKGAVVQSLAVNNARRPFKQKETVIEVALQPGRQNIVLTWQQQGGIGASFSVPRIDLGSAAANFHLSVQMPSNRWLLFASGPSWGPAVLFWGYLLTIIIISFFILGRTERSHLKGWQWALLSLGLTQIPIGVALIIVAWFFLIHWRSTNPLKSVQYVWHNLLQTGVGIWTFVALICLLVAVYNGLAVQPDMQVAGLGSSNTELNWYTDHLDGQTPAAHVWSIPILIWKGIMLAWALWLSYSLIAWARWGFHSFSEGGIWREAPPRVPKK